MLYIECNYSQHMTIQRSVNYGLLTMDLKRAMVFMDLPRNNPELERLFIKARVPELSEFNGEYFVDMLTKLPSLRRFSHRKIFYQNNNKITGYNILFSNLKWGHFFLEKGVCSDINSLDVLVINYNCSKNGFVTRKIIDHVRALDEKGVYLGRFNYMCSGNGKPKFSGYFSLIER